MFNIATTEPCIAQPTTTPFRSTLRENKSPRLFPSYMVLMSVIIDFEPTSFEEEASHQVWRDVVMEEYASIVKNDVWDIMLRPEGKSMVRSRGIFKTKHTGDGNIEKYKARFMARGFFQKEGMDYEETFAPVTRYTSIRAIISIAS
jgi:hypothetical protein